MLRTESAWVAGGLLVASLFSSVSCKAPAQKREASPAASSAAHVQRRRPGAECQPGEAACACAERRALELLAACFADKAFDAASRAPADCKSAKLAGVRAEALAAAGRDDEARAAAELVAKGDPTNRFARRAQAIVLLNERAFDKAEVALGALIREDAADVDSLFYSALVSRARDRYNDARQGFLRVLHLNKRHIDARYNLVTLTAALGAAEEARHHLAELSEIAPIGDPRLSLAKTAVAEASPKEPTAPVVLKRGE
jgi:tetratricopeptide (TPR) repeat protein